MKHEVSPQRHRENPRPEYEFLNTKDTKITKVKPKEDCFAARGFKAPQATASGFPFHTLVILVFKNSNGFPHLPLCLCG
jgi:hypothetical protein